MRKRRLIILGSTGSIGTSTLEAVEHLEGAGVQFEVVGLAAGRNASLAGEQAQRFGVRHLAIVERNGERPCGAAPTFEGPDAALRMVESVAQPGDLVVGAMVGAAGLAPTLAAIDRGCDIALANKETLVAAGELVMPLVRERGVHLLPVDSEHSAIFQCLQSGRSIDEVRRLVITASGGPFRTWPVERVHAATVEEALDHPTWNMGRKVTIDSASMMNKALEMIEAHWLFGLPSERIEPIIHPQSIVHSFVEFVDGSTIAQLSPPDMRLPIQYALTWPERLDGCARRMDWDSFRRLDFEAVDTAKFPAVDLARRVMVEGGTAGAVFNAANEVAVEAFLERRIAFGQIPELVAEAMDQVSVVPVRTLADIDTADAAAREVVGAAVADAQPS
ncbi:MAG: 1-deoxy-D-xylulose-5-phosphate reductoisomerase [Phycisphaerales bacterium]|nr:1-deoxy-D-xylulose-5-phosphate reductoisomerase [Phycisphaerales bacterium]